MISRARASERVGDPPNARQDLEPLSERKLAAMFGKASRRWARNRIAEAADGVAPAATQ